MQTHLTGAITGTRQGSAVCQQSFSLDYANNLSAVPIKLCTIKASPAQPVSFRLTALTATAFVNGANASTLSIGTASGGTQLLNAVDMKAAVGTNYATTLPVWVVTADTEIWAVRTDTATAATAGQVIIQLHMAEVNIKQPTTQGD